MEHSPPGQYEDRASQAFWYRGLPAPPREVREEGERVEIETEHLLLHYQVSPRGFTPRTLTVQVKATGAEWRFGDLPWKGGNLQDTARTLDGTSGEVRMEPGLMGRAGWAVVDDSRSLVFNDSGWLEPRAHPENADL